MNLSPVLITCMQYVVFGVLIYFALYHKLSSHPITTWDESLFSLRALSLYETGSYLSNFNIYDDLPNHRNTKLPFTTLLQVLGYKLFGVNEYGVRIPTVSVLVVTILLMIRHFRRDYGSRYFGFLFGLITLSTLGLYGIHMARSGDQDVAYSCYLLVATLSFGKYLHTNATRYLIYFTLSFIAAILTKNLLAGLIFPGVLIYTLLSGQLGRCLKDYRIYLSVLGIGLAYGGTLAYFESQYPGFVDRMWNYELMGRYQTIIEEHQGPPLYYLRLLQERFSPYIYLIPFVIGYSFHPRVPAMMKCLIQIVSCAFVSYIAIISLSETKTFWYLAPNYLFGIYLVSAGLLMLYLLHKDRLGRSDNMILLSSFLLIFGLLYSSVINEVISPSVKSAKDERYGKFISLIEKRRPTIKSFLIYDNNFGTTAYFYKRKHEYQNPELAITYKREVKNIESGQLIMSCLNNVLDPLSKLYDHEVIEQWHDCKLIKINSLQNDNNSTQD